MSYIILIQAPLQAFTAPLRHIEVSVNHVCVFQGEPFSNLEDRTAAGHHTSMDQPCASKIDSACFLVQQHGTVYIIIRTVQLTEDP